MNKNLLAAAIAATCALGVVHTNACAAVKAKSQSLGDLSCLENQIAGFNGELWACIDKPSDGEPGLQGPPGEQGLQGEVGPEGPPGDGGGGGAYEFVDGDGNILGDVVYIEDRNHAFGYFDYLSTNSIIEVTVGINKDQQPFWSFSGDFIPINPGVYYREDDCSGTAYATKPAPRPVSLLDLLSVPFYYLGGNSTWSEIIYSDVPAPPEFDDSSWYIKTSWDGGCSGGGSAYNPMSREVSFGVPVSRPSTPIFIVEKP